MLGVKILATQSCLASRTAGNKRARARLVYFQSRAHMRVHALMHARSTRLRTSRNDTTTRIDDKFKCDRSQRKEREAQRNGVSEYARTHAQTHVYVVSQSVCPTNAFKYRIWSTLPATRRWDCASVIFSILHSARVVSSISRGARTLLFVYPPPHSHSAFISSHPPSPLHLYFLRLISSYTYIPSRTVTTDVRSLPS